MDKGKNTVGKQHHCGKTRARLLPKKFTIGLLVILAFMPSSFTEAAPNAEGPERDLSPLEKSSVNAASFEERWAEFEKLRFVIQSTATPEEKRMAMAAFRKKQKGWMAEMPSKTPQATEQERAASRERMNQWIANLPADQRQNFQNRLGVREDVEKFRAEMAGLTLQQQRERFQSIEEKLRKTVNPMVAAAKEAQFPTNMMLESSFVQKLRSEREKFQTTMKSADPQQKQIALQQFWIAVESIRQSWMAEIEASTQQSNMPASSEEASPLPSGLSTPQ